MRIMKMASTCLTLILILTLSAAAISAGVRLACAQEANIYTDSPTYGPVEPGGTFTIYIMVDGIPSPGVNIWDMHISFDPSSLIIKNPKTDIAEGDWASQYGWTTSGITYAEILPSNYMFGAFLMSSNGVTGSGINLASITFTVVGPGNCTLHLFNAKLVESDLVTIIPSTIIDATFFTDTPKAGFSYTYMNSTLRTPIVGETITFNASYNPVTRTGSYDPDPGGYITNYAWSFGDGSTASGLIPVIKHAYATTGDYATTLTVTDNAGLINSGGPRFIHVARRDIAVTDLKIIPAVAKLGTIVSINVTVTNLGTEAEYFNVSLTYKATSTPPTLIPYDLTNPWGRETDYCLDLEPGPNMRPPGLALLPGNSITITYQWNTSGLPGQEYNVRADAEIIPSSNRFNIFFAGVENNYANNEKQSIAIVIVVPSYTATVNITPETLNLKSAGHWITTYIELPKGYNVSDIDVSSIMLNGTIPVDMTAPITIGDHNNDYIPDLMVEFNMTAVESYIYNQAILHGNADPAHMIFYVSVPVSLTITGKLADGTLFTGTTSIIVNYFDAGASGGGGGLPPRPR
jgi:hypothetical protein